MSPLVVLVIAFAALTCAAPVDNSFVEFQAFIARFGKSYSTPDEFMMRYEIFQQTMQRVANLRAEHKLATGESGEEVFGVTKFADLTPREFSAYKGFTPHFDNSIRTIAQPSNEAIPTSVDWRQKGVVTAVKDQGQCGSCWAFSTAEEIESANAMAGNKLVELSVEQIVDCDTVDQGCNGGDTISGYAYVKQAGGLELESSYPYTAGGGDSGNCQAVKSKEVVALHNYSYAVPGCTDSCNKQNETLLKANLATHGPISICVNAEPWQTYTGGILSSGCTHAYSDLDHCVQLVGYDDTGAKPYWIIRNSWNTNWGIEGYIHVAIGSNLCGIADEATLVSAGPVKL